MSEESKLDEACGGEPVPSTSTANTPSEPAPQRLSVYSHIEGIQHIGQLRGLRTGRRRARFRGMRKSTVAVKYTEALSIFEPIILEESLRLEEAQTLVAAAIEHFAITVTGIVDQLEGKEHEHIYGDRIERYKRRARDRAGATQEAEVKPELSEEQRKENDRRLAEETEAAVAALSCGDTRGERLPSMLRFVKRMRNVAIGTDDRSDDSSDSD